jgi:hypothetical protein
MNDNNTQPDRITELFEDGTAIHRAVRQAGLDALARHRREGRPAVVWQDGKVVWLPPDQIPVPRPDES